MVGADERGVSEILGTTFVISLSLLSALAVVGLGTVAIQGVTDHSTDSVGQEALSEMEKRLSSLSGDSVDSSTTFEFPDRTGDDVQIDPSEGTVTIKAENTVTGQTAQTQIDLGTITYETSDGRTLIVQGGALFEQSSPGSASLIEKPSFDFVNDQLDLDLMQIDSSTPLRAGQRLTAQRMVATSKTLRSDILADLAPTWRVAADGTQYGVEPVTVTMTFETKYYRGWEAYAGSYMTDSPDKTDITARKNQVTMTFDDVGHETDLLDEVNNFESVVYAGHARYAKLSDDITNPGDHQLKIEDTDTVAVYDNPSGSDIEGSWAVNEGGTNWDYYPVPESGPGNNNVQSSDIDDFDFNTDNVGTYADDLPICVVDGTTSDMKEAIDDGDCFEQMMGVSNPRSLDPDSNFTIDNVDIDTTNHNLTAEITNEGYLDDTQYVTLIDTHSGSVVDYNDSSAGNPVQLDVGETKEIELSWQDESNPPESVLNDTGETRIETENDAVTSTKPSGGASQPNSNFVVSDISINNPPSTNWEYNDTVSMDVTVENSGSEEDTQNITLDLDGRTVDLAETHLDYGAGPGATETVTFDAHLRGVSRTAELTVSTDDDTASATVLVDPKPLSDPEMRLYRPPLSVDIDYVELRN